MKKRNKNDLPVFDSNHDFLKEFEKKEEAKTGGAENTIDCGEKNKVDKHGMPVLDALSVEHDFTEVSSREEFIQLLEASFKKGKAKPVKKPPSVPVKKRLKRYPPVEIELDLHGYTAIGAQVKAQSFIHTCKQQGIFTLRIIVGKGLHSDIGPVLPDVVEDVLQELKKQDLVIWYEWDKKKKSKSGAVIVYIKHFERFE
ncbi:Smr/MutS family protein [Desulfobacula phenolica]|uniref:Smr/MutS family protein n=1 Tax=Desulfobacula phenolica TaxID=90732 RepID=UPI001FE062B0|nr:Smr/MutS family protein [Desulfobacula phenolica]